MAEVQRQICLVDDDPDFCSDFKKNFSQFFRVTTYSDPKSALTIASDPAKAEVVLIDLHMSPMDGMGFFLELKSRASKMPPCFLYTVDSSIGPKLTAFEIGFDDVLLKSMDVREVSARIQRKLRFESAGPSAEGDGLELCRIRRKCFVDNVDVDLTSTEFLILSVLISENKKNISKQKLIHSVWSDRSISSHTVNTHVYNLNKKLFMWNKSIVISKDGTVSIMPRTSKSSEN